MPLATAVTQAEEETDEEETAAEYRSRGDLANSPRARAEAEAATVAACPSNPGNIETRTMSRAAVCWPAQPRGWGRSSLAVSAHRASGGYIMFK